MEVAESTKYQENSEVGSYNHSFTQARITALLSQDKRFATFVELSLDASRVDLSQFGLNTKEELKPDVCLYPNFNTGIKSRDILRMSEMPLLVIEIISPKQGIDDILAKFEGYFALGVQSCWLITPNYGSIAVHSQVNDFKLFDTERDTEVIDKKLDIRVSMADIFK